MRDGAKSVPADERQYEKFIAQRSSIVRELLKYKDKPVDVYTIHPGTENRGTKFTPWGNNPMIEGSNQFYLTLRMGNEYRSIPLGRIELSYNHERNTLRLDVHQYAVPRH